MEEDVKNCLLFVVDKKNSQLYQDLGNFAEEFDKDVSFHTIWLEKNQVEVIFTFKNGNDDQLVEFLWNVVRYFKNGTYRAIEKITYQKIKLHPLLTSVS